MSFMAQPLHNTTLELEWCALVSILILSKYYFLLHHLPFIFFPLLSHLLTPHRHHASCIRPSAPISLLHLDSRFSCPSTSASSGTHGQCNTCAFDNMR